MLAMFVARPMSVEPSSSSPGCSTLCDSVGSALTDVCVTAAADCPVAEGPDTPVGESERGSSGSSPGPFGRRVELWGREAGDVSFSGRKTI